MSSQLHQLTSSRVSSCGNLICFCVSVWRDVIERRWIRNRRGCCCCHQHSRIWKCAHVSQIPSLCSYCLIIDIQIRANKTSQAYQQCPAFVPYTVKRGRETDWKGESVREKKRHGQREKEIENCGGKKITLSSSSSVETNYFLQSPFFLDADLYI